MKLKEFFTYFLVYSILLAIPFVGVALLWIGLIALFGFAGFVLSIAITVALVIGWIMALDQLDTMEAWDRLRKSKYMD